MRRTEAAAARFLRERRAVGGGSSGRLRPYWLGAALLGLAFAADAKPAEWTDCDLGDIRIQADFPAARADACYRQAPDQVAVLIMPEAANINPSPWYAFRISSDGPRTVRVTLVYGEGKHRYWPKLSEDGRQWQRLADKALHVSDDGSTATLKLGVDAQPLWVAAQELWPAERYAQWLGTLSARQVVDVSRLGWSVQRRPIDVLSSPRSAEQAGTVVLVGRQHPPEVPGAIVLQPFMEALLEDSELARHFRRRYQVVAVPELNPDGVAMGHWRQNAGGVDINRDWGPFTQPETRLMRDLLASLARDEATSPRVLLDFHATREDVFYTQRDEDPVVPQYFERRWLARTQERLPGYTVNRKPGHQADTPTAKTWVYKTYGIPAVTFEVGDETDRDIVWRLGQESARALMETLLDEPAQPARAVEADTHFRFDGWSGPPLQVWLALPEAVTADTPVLFVMHGVNRDASRYRDEWSALARSAGFIAVVPEFDAASFPGARSYNLGNMLDAAGDPQPRDRWSFAVVEALFDHVKAMTGTQVERYSMYGHSAGAQFVHRYVMFMPEARLAQAVAANAGWYTVPEAGTPFPYGLDGSPLSPQELAQALGRRLSVLLGTADVDPAYPNLRRTTEAMAQGPHRLARGQYFHRRALAAASALGVDLAWRLQLVEGVAHDNAAMASPAAALLFPQPAASP